MGTKRKRMVLWLDQDEYSYLQRMAEKELDKIMQLIGDGFKGKTKYSEQEYIRLLILSDRTKKL